MNRAQFLRASALGIVTVAFGHKFPPLPGEELLPAPELFTAEQTLEAHINIHSSILSAHDQILRQYYLPVVQEHLNSHRILLLGFDPLSPKD